MECFIKVYEIIQYSTKQFTLEYSSVLLGLSLSFQKTANSFLEMNPTQKVTQNFSFFQHTKKVSVLHPLRLLFAPLYTQSNFLSFLPNVVDGNAGFQLLLFLWKLSKVHFGIQLGVNDFETDRWDTNGLIPSFVCLTSGLLEE